MDLEGEMSNSWWRKWWWALTFCLSVGFVYLHFIKQKKNDVAQLSIRLEDMEKKRGLALEERETLRLQIASQNDPSWIEMILMRDLGVVPEGWLKVHFSNK